jgi:AcrR family transcriptional regulator
MSQGDSTTASALSSLAAGRRPAQKRSQLRVTALLDAADRLLQDRDINDIGLYDVAHMAKVPPTSAYHFFPTKESVFLALAQRYLQTLHAALQAPLDLDAIEHWQDLVAIRYQRVVDYFNASLSARKLFIGMAVGSDVKKLDFDDMDNLVLWTYRSMDAIFEMPFVRDPAFKFTVLFGIQDGIWASSYAKHGYITPAFGQEGLRAGLAYLSTFLPQTIALRAPGGGQVPPIPDAAALPQQTPPKQPTPSAPRVVRKRSARPA